MPHLSHNVNSDSFAQHMTEIPMGGLGAMTSDEALDAPDANSRRVGLRVDDVLSVNLEDNGFEGHFIDVGEEILP